MGMYHKWLKWTLYYKIVINMWKKKREWVCKSGQRIYSLWFSKIHTWNLNNVIVQWHDNKKLNDNDVRSDEWID